jgi:hypothetical protein
MTDDYVKEHICCPECGSIIKEINNEVSCSCGWKGISDDLIPDRMSAQRLRNIYKTDEKIDLNNPSSWDDEMIADYFIWIMKKKGSSHVEIIMNNLIERIKNL